MSGRGVGTSHCALVALQLPGPLGCLNMASLVTEIPLGFSETSLLFSSFEVSFLSAVGNSAPISGEARLAEEEKNQ